MNVPHSQEFFEQMNTCREAYHRLALAFMSVLPRGVPVLDIGCGTGQQSAALARLGFTVVGVDPLTPPELVEQAEGFTFAHVDALAGELALSAPRSVICTETAEHVYPERAEALVRECCRDAESVIIFSAARPGNEWEGHVNLQEPAYWLEKFRARGWSVDETLTTRLRANMLAVSAQHCGATENFYVFTKTP